MRPGCGVLTTDVCVPISSLADCITATQADIAEHGLTASIVGHVGDGNFHTFVLLDRDDPADIARGEEFHARLVRRALDADGTCTGEHGVGYGKARFLVEEHGRPAVEMMRAVKHALDPDGIFNPGKTSRRRRAALTPDRAAVISQRTRGRRSRRRSAPASDRPRGRYHWAVWLTIPRSASSARRGLGPQPGTPQHAADQPLERLAAGADLAPALPGLDQVALLLEDEHVVAMRDDVGHPQPHERPQLVLGGTPARRAARCAGSSSGSIS